MNKCTRVAIKNCKELDYKAMNEKLKELRYQTCKASNRIIQLAYMRELEKLEYKKQYGKYPDDKEQYGMSYRNVLYHTVQEQMNIANTSNISQTVGIISSKFKNDLKDILKYKKSLPSFKLNMPIYISNQSFKISQNNRGYEIACSLFNKEQDISRLTFALDKLDGNKKATLNKIMEGVYKQGAGQITQDKHSKWYFNISFSFETEEKGLDTNRILGVDIGITNAATMQIWDNTKQDWDWLSWNECVLDGKELIHYRQKTEQRYHDLFKNCKVAGEGRTGHGRLTKIQPVDTMRDKISNFRDTLNHKYSRYIVDFAIKHNCGIIQMEDLSGFNVEQSERLLKNWSYYDLQNKIQYKAKEAGIEVIFINPYMTSKRCSKCGCIHPDNRDCKNSQARFKCVVCGHEENADINAARNISLPDIENIIKG
jgi:putative transposase